MQFTIAKSAFKNKYIIWEFKQDGKFDRIYFPLTKFNNILSIIDLYELEIIFKKYNGYMEHDGRRIIDYDFSSQYSAKKFLNEIFIPTFIAWKLLP